MITQSGRILYLEDFRTLDPMDLPLDDIQDALERINRFSGHGISVMQHSSQLYRIAEHLRMREAFQIACLVHDISEMAGMIDIPAPEKKMPCWAPIVEIQEAFQQRIYDHCGVKLSESEWQTLHALDRLCAWMETYDLMSEIRMSIRNAWQPAPVMSQVFRDAWYATYHERNYPVQLAAILPNWSLRSGDEEAGS